VRGSIGIRIGDGQPTQQAAYAGRQFIQIVGFDQKIIGPFVQQRDPVTDAAARGGDHDAGFHMGALQTLQQHFTADVGQTQVENDKVVVVAVRSLGKFFATNNPVDGKALLAQVLLNGTTQHFVVFNQQYTHGISPDVSWCHSTHPLWMASLRLTIPAFNKSRLQPGDVDQVLHLRTETGRTAGLKFAASVEYSRFF
jgi:hypothetical protein